MTSFIRAQQDAIHAFEFSDPRAAEAMQLAEMGGKPACLTEICPLEHSEQVTLFALAKRYSAMGIFPKARMLYSNPNARPTGDKGHKIYMADEGLRPGIPDIFLPVQASGYPGLYIELKRADWFRHTYPSTEQRDWIDSLRLEGYRVEVAPGAFIAWCIIMRYLADMRDKRTPYIDDTCAERIARQRADIIAARQLGLTPAQFERKKKAESTKRRVVYR